MRRTTLQGLSALVLAIGSLAACDVDERSYASGTGGGSASGTGGSGSSTGTGGAGGMALSAEAACEEYAAITCLAYEKCLPFSQATTFGDNDTCQARSAILCIAALTAPMTAWTPERKVACANAYKAGACASVINSFYGGGPAECRAPAGSRANGLACIESGQCASGYCKMKGEMCGACASLSLEKSGCQSSLDCADGLTCFNTQCAVASAVGEGCVSGQIPCRPGLFCSGDVCRPPGEEGDLCGDPSVPPCNFLQGLHCNAESQSCKKTLLAGPDQPCGVVGPEFYSCTASAACRATSPQLCIPAVPDGGACGVEGSSAGCMPPAVCVSGSCTLPDPAQCG